MKFSAANSQKLQNFDWFSRVAESQKWNFTHFLTIFCWLDSKIFSANLIIDKCPHEGLKVGFWCTNLLNVNDAILHYKPALKRQVNAGNKVRAVKNIFMHKLKRLNFARSTISGKGST